MLSADRNNKTNVLAVLPTPYYTTHILQNKGRVNSLLKLDVYGKLPTSNRYLWLNLMLFTNPDIKLDCLIDGDV
jgi:hypothetical protein